MKNKSLLYILGGTALVAVVGVAVYFSSGTLFKGAIGDFLGGGPGTTTVQTDQTTATRESSLSDSVADTSTLSRLAGEAAKVPIIQPGSFKVSPPIIGLDDFNKGERVNISFELSKSSMVRLWISGTKAVLIKKIVGPEILSDSKVHNYTWDGKNDNGTTVSPGKYGVNLDILSSDGTTSESVEQTLNIVASATPPADAAPVMTDLEKAEAKVETLKAKIAGLKDRLATAGDADKAKISTLITATEAELKTAQEEVDKLKEKPVSFIVKDSFKVTPQTISPDGDGKEDVASISYKVTVKVLTRLTVFNEDKILVVTPQDKKIVEEGSITLWAGNNSDGKTVVPNGIYTVKLEIFDSKDKLIETAIQKITVLVPEKTKPGQVTFTATPEVISPDGDGKEDETKILIQNSIKDTNILLQVLDKSDVVVIKLLNKSKLNIGETRTAWDGTRMSSGDKVPNGNYTIKLEIFDSKDKLIETAIQKITVLVPEKTKPGQEAPKEEGKKPQEQSQVIQQAQRQDNQQQQKSQEGTQQTGKPSGEQNKPAATEQKTQQGQEQKTDDKQKTTEPKSSDAEVKAKLELDIVKLRAEEAKAKLEKARTEAETARTKTGGSTGSTPPVIVIQTPPSPTASSSTKTETSDPITLSVSPRNFSPNGDGTNDFTTITVMFNESVMAPNLEIVNRTDTAVVKEFRGLKNDYKKGETIKETWTGDGKPEGRYIVKAEATLLNGKSFEVTKNVYVAGAETTTVVTPQKPETLRPAAPIADVIKVQCERFIDVNAGNPFYAAIEYLRSSGIVKGSSGCKFGPFNTINRAEFVKLLFDSFKLPVSSGLESSFRDVESGKWFSDTVNTAGKKKFVQGYSDGTFGPATTINTAEALKTFLNMAGKADEVEKISVQLNVCPDVRVADYNKWYMPYFQYATNIGLRQKTDNCAPSALIKRGGVAEWLHAYSKVSK